MFGIFKKKTRKAITEVKKMENRDAVEATVWGAYSIAFADGTCDAKEIENHCGTSCLCAVLR